LKACQGEQELALRSFAQPRAVHLRYDKHGRLRDVLKLLFAKVYKRELHPTAYVLIHLAGDADPPGSARFRGGSDVDAVGIDAGIVKDNVTLIDADTEALEAWFVYISISLRHRPLEFYAHSVG